MTLWCICSLFSFLLIELISYNIILLGTFNLNDLLLFVCLWWWTVESHSKLSPVCQVTWHVIILFSIHCNSHAFPPSYYSFVSIFIASIFILISFCSQTINGKVVLWIMNDEYKTGEMNELMNETWLFHITIILTKKA